MRNSLNPKSEAGRELRSPSFAMLKPIFAVLAGASLSVLVVAGCASHPKDFIPNGAGVNLEPTNPDHIQVLNEIPRGMVIGTVLVDRAKSKDTADIIQAARLKAASVGGDFIVWQDSLGTTPAPSASPAAGQPPPSAYSGDLGHSSANPSEPLPEDIAEKTPKARFVVGIFLPGGRAAQGQ